MFMELQTYLTKKPSPDLFPEIFEIKKQLNVISEEFNNFISHNKNDLQIIDPVVKYKDLNLRKDIDTSWLGVKLKAQTKITENKIFLENFKRTLPITNYPRTTTILLNIVRGNYTTTYHRDVPLALAVFFRLTPKNNSVIKFDFPQYNSQDLLSDYGDFTFFQSQTLHCNMNIGPDEVRGIFVGFV